ncbi:aminotransferase class V-fold PLP-dependent enzyme, partial [Staphylococcus warneri]|uniref:aminotransferase class V-fold PLP-dependent enzyme n=1 Tax=Staphylococcus warneri TaxID=1292 RepID=UPI0011AAE21A
MKDFPILQQQLNPKPLPYLHSTPTTQTPLQLLNLLHDYYNPYNSNLHTQLHTLASLPTHPYHTPPQTLTPFINPKYFQQIIFTTGTT